MTARADLSGHLLAQGLLALAPGAIRVRLFTGDPPGPPATDLPGYTRSPEPSWTAVSWEDWEYGAMRWTPDRPRTELDL